MDNGSAEIGTGTRRDFLKSVIKSVVEPVKSVFVELLQDIPKDKYPQDTAVNRGLFREELSRRSLLKAGGEAVVLTTGGLVATKLGIDRIQTPPKVEMPKTNTPKIQAPVLEVEKPSEKLPNVDVELLNKILSQKPGTDGRINAEKTYLPKAISTIQIDMALKVFSTQELRKELIDRAFTLRQNGKNPLPTNIEKWAVDRHQHPETAATCWEMEEPSKKIIQGLLDEYINEPITDKNIQKDVKEIIKGLGLSKEVAQKLNSHAIFRPDLAHLVKVGKLPWGVLLNLKAEDIMPNVGAMTELVCRESGIAYQRKVGKDASGNDKFDLASYGFVNPGYGTAVQNINRQKFPKGIEQIQKIAVRMSEAIGLKFLAENLPGSKASDTDQSGGAVGTPQFIPEKVIELWEFLEETEKRKQLVKGLQKPLLPSDKDTAVVMAWIFLARGQLTGQGDSDWDYRYGYLRGDNPIKLQSGGSYDHSSIVRWNAIDKWNRDDDEIKAILTAGENYTKFGII